MLENISITITTEDDDELNVVIINNDDNKAEEVEFWVTENYKHFDNDQTYASLSIEQAIKVRDFLNKNL